jgi:hypothetical protein
MKLLISIGVAEGSNPTLSATENGRPLFGAFHFQQGRVCGRTHRVRQNRGAILDDAHASPAGRGPGWPESIPPSPPLNLFSIQWLTSLAILYCQSTAKFWGLRGTNHDQFRAILLADSTDEGNTI